MCQRALTKCMAWQRHLTSLSVSLPEAAQAEGRRQRGKRGVGGHVLRFFLGSHTRRCPTKRHCSWPTPLPPVPALSACLRGVVSLPRFRRRQLRGRISKDSGRRRRDGRAPLQLQPAGHVGSPSSTQTKTTCRARDDDAIATRLEADLLPRSELCSPSPMAQAEPPMAWPAMRPSFLAA